MLTYTYSTCGAVAWIAIDRPEKLNAMPRSFWPELQEIVARAEADQAVRVIIFHGSGRCFSVGGDIADFGALTDAADRREYVSEALFALRAVEAMSKPTIAAVHGYAFGGGCELTMVCDIVVADQTASFATPEASVGLVPGLGVVRGGAHLNLHWIKYMVLTGESLDAQEALTAGLVNKVVPAGDHLTEAERIAKLIARRAPLAMAVGKATLGGASDQDYAHGISAVSYLQTTTDFGEGIKAFNERRDPEFEGR